MTAMMMDTKKAHQCMLVGYPKQTPRDMPIMMMNIVAYHHSGTSLYLRIILDDFESATQNLLSKGRLQGSWEAARFLHPNDVPFGLRKKMRKAGRSERYAYRRCTSSSSVRMFQTLFHRSGPWNSAVWTITAAIAAKESPYVRAKVVERNSGE